MSDAVVRKKQIGNTTFYTNFPEGKEVMPPKCGKCDELKPTRIVYFRSINGEQLEGRVCDSCIQKHIDFVKS